MPRSRVALKADWFEQVFGFPEAPDYHRTKEQFEYDPGTGTLTAKPDRGEETKFCAGRFETPSLDELRERVDLKQASKLLGGRRLAIKEVIGDVSQFHIKAANRYAIFQAASQFNTLEHTSQRGTPELGIACYSGDRTQGPACATACAPGTIVRNYFGLDGRGQSTKRQVRNLAEIELLLENREKEYFSVVNGYTMSSTSDLKRLTEALRGDEDTCESIRRKLRIGVQTDTEVVCSSFGMKMYSGARNEQLVTQAYCSAVSVSYSRCSDESWEVFARLILEGLYEATLYAAVENALRHPEAEGARKVFLTAVGGGVFGNDMAWVRDAIWRAAQLFEHVGLHVFLVSYGGSTLEFKELEVSWEAATAASAAAAPAEEPATSANPISAAVAAVASTTQGG